MIKTKNIIIKTFGPLHILRGINGPVLTPFKAHVSDIMHMLNVKYEVYEVGADGTEVLLTKDNYLSDNFKPKQPKQQQTPNTPPPVSEQTGTGESEGEKSSDKETVVTDLTDDKSDKQPNNQNNKNQNFNKNKR